MMPTRFNVGDTITITPQNMQTMRNSNRSCVTPNYPSDSFLALCQSRVNMQGTVTHTFLPGYEITVEIHGQRLHMKDHWVTRVA